MAKPLTTKDIAAHCNVTQRAVVQWINNGKLKAFRTPGNHIRVDQRDFMKFLNEFDIAMPEDIINAQLDNKTKRILIVDNNQELAISYRHLLSKNNIFEVDVAFDGFDVGHKFVAFKPNLVVLNVQLSGMGGGKICEKLRNVSEGQDLKILAIIGEDNNGGIQEILSKGADDYLIQPFSDDQFMDKIMQHFGWTRRSSDNK